jgi:iron complex outermembrane receptor protein
MLRMGTKYGIPVQTNPGNALIRAFVGNQQWGWLPRVEIRHSSGTLTLGTELRVHRSTHWGKISHAEQLPPNYDPDYHFYEYRGVRDIFSLYGSEVLTLPGDLTLMADVQAVYNRYGIEEEKFLDNEFSIGYFFLNPRAGLNYNFSPSGNVYLSCGYTSREPRMRNLYAAEDAYYGATPQFVADTSNGSVVYDFSNPFARPERLLNVELGGGYRSDRYRVLANIYLMDFRNELVKSGKIDVFGQSVTGNAEHTVHMGVEIEGSVDISPVLSFSGNMTLSRNRHVRHTVYEGSTPVTYDGNPVAGFPDLLANARVTYHNTMITASISAKYVGIAYTDNSHSDSRKNDAWMVCNVDMLADLPEFAGISIRVRAEINNLFNALYFMNGEGDAFFPAAERNYLIGTSVTL